MGVMVNVVDVVVVIVCVFMWSMWIDVYVTHILLMYEMIIERCLSHSIVSVLTIWVMVLMIFLVSNMIMMCTM